MKKTLAPLAIALSLMLTACGSGSPDAGSAQPSSTTAEEAPLDTTTEDVSEEVLFPAGQFMLITMSGADIKFDLPVPSSDERLREIEKFRKDAGADPVTYIIADIDNRQGSEYVNMYDVTAYDVDGKKYEFSGVSDFIDEWGPTYTSDYDYVLPDGTKMESTAGEALYSRGSDLSNEYLDGIDAAERGPMVLASKASKLPNEFTRVAVHPSGGMNEAEEALPADWDGAE